MSIHARPRTRIRKPKDPRSAIPILQRALASGITFFVGAGISVGSGLPSQDEMKNEILRLLCEGDSFLENLYRRRKRLWEHQMHNVMLESFLQLIQAEDKCTIQKFASIFKHGTPSGYHECIASLLASGRVKAVITTNFDRLIEFAYSRHVTERGERRPSKLNVVIEDALKTDIGNHPLLLKLHGCASLPNSLSLTLGRVGTGLEPWKEQVLKRLSKTTFVFLGYSDRDSDITPTLSRLRNEWIWFFFNGVPLTDHIDRDTPLDDMLSRQNRTVLYTEPLHCLVSFSESILGQGAIGRVGTFIPQARWKDSIASALRKLPSFQRASILGGFLREQLSELYDAEKVFCHLLRNRHLPTKRKADLLLRLVAVYSDIPMRRKAQHETLEKVGRLISDCHISDSTIKARFYHSKGVYAFQESQIQLQESIKLYRVAHRFFIKNRIRLHSAQNIMNLAVALQIKGELIMAGSYYEESVKTFREEGRLDKLAMALVNYGAYKSLIGKVKESRQHYEEAIRVLEHLGNKNWLARAKVNLAYRHHFMGRHAEAKLLVEEARPFLLKMKDADWMEMARVLTRK